MAWIESHQELARHPKTRRLARLLGESTPSVIGRMHLLWWWALDYADDGDLSRHEAADIADACCWEGDSQEFVDALVAVHFIDVELDNRVVIHDWDDYAGRLVTKRRANVERVRRWRAHNESPANAPETATPPIANGAVTHNERVGYVATVPNRTGPDSTGPEDATAIAVDATTAPAAPVPKPSSEARQVLEQWRAAHGKRKPPKLNPTQLAALEEALADLGMARIAEAVLWSAGKGLDEFHKCITAAYSKRQQDEAPTPVLVNGRAPPNGRHAQAFDLNSPEERAAMKALNIMTDDELGN